MTFDLEKLDSTLMGQAGILGGGQLSLMLVNAAHRMGLKPIVFTEDSHSPVAQIYSRIVYGSTEDVLALERFFSQVDYVLFENEFLDCLKLKAAVGAKKVSFYPSLEVIRILQNKLQQKELLKSLGIPSPRFLTFSNLQEVRKCFGGTCVLKWARMGYDGKGVYVLKNTEASLRLAEEFCKAAKKRGSIVYAESFVPFKRELALIGVCSTVGEFISYPLVISEQKDGICSRVYGPALSFGVKQEVQKLAQAYAQKIAFTLQVQGAFAIEFFETPEGELLVNEIAPRVHNSGHYTQNACPTDQFENHWRAVLGLPLGSHQPTSFFAMLNILGPDFTPTQGKRSLLPFPGPSSHLHWYHKGEVRPRRKLGHLNGTVTQAEEMDTLLEELEGSHQQWINQVQEVKK